MKPIVVKLGGRTLETVASLAHFAADIRALGRPVVIVHGGGAEVSDWASRLGLTPTFVDGRRVTDAATLDVAVAILAGLVNSRLSAGLRACGVVGLSGVDGGLLRACPHPDAARLGKVGVVESVDVDLLRALLDAGKTPLIAPIAAFPDGQLCNVNADDVAAAVAVALGAGTLLLLSDVPTLLVEGLPVTRLSLDAARAALGHADVKGGMKPKLEAAITAMAGGVGEAIIGAFGGAGSLTALLNGSAIGTRIDAERPERNGASRPVSAESDLLAGVYPFPRPRLVSGSGTRVRDAEGREYLDFVSGIAVNALGHAHPEIRAAVSAQMGQVGHVSNLYGNDPAVALASRLTRLTGFARVFFCNSGSEGIEAALKFSRLHARARDRANGVIIAFEGAFHGRTAFALSVTANPAYREPFEPLVPGIRFAPYNDPAGFDAVVAAAAAEGHPLAAVLVEPVQGESGAIAATAEFLAHLRRRTSETGSLLLFDEVQIGVGRSGSFLASQGFGIRPDMTVLAKGLGGGIPIGAVLLSAEVASLLKPGHHGTTFGGNPVAAAAANVVVDTVATAAFLESVRQRTEQLSAGLDRLVAKHPSIQATRGLGLLRAVVLSDDAGYDSGALVGAAAAERLLLCKGGAAAVRLLPPLTVSAAEIDEALARLDRALSTCEAVAVTRTSAELAPSGKGSDR